MTFKPKKQQIAVPGHGIVQKQDFTQAHFDILIKRATDKNRDEFIKQYFEVASYGDQPLFAEDEAEKARQEAEEKKAEKEKLKAEAKAERERKKKEAEDAELLKQMEAEEEENKKLQLEAAGKSE